MDYVSKKLNTLTGEALSGVANEFRRKTQRQGRESEPEQLQETVAPEPHDERYIYYPNVGIPFGGDTRTPALRPPPPPIGFKLSETSDSAAATQASKLPQPPHDSGTQNQLGSSESLYQGDAWTRLWFQRVMIITLLRLLLFIRKVYEDYSAAKLYSITGQTGHLLTAGATLLLPTVVFAIYRVARYLQLSLPQVDLKSSAALRAGETNGGKRTVVAALQGPSGEGDSHLHRALMSSPTMSASGTQSPSAPLQLEDDGLVTARQTPTQLDEQFHDSQSSHTEQTERRSPVGSAGATDAIVRDFARATPTPTSRRGDAEYKERVNVNKLGNLPDKETTRIVIGASEQLLHGALFIFWQLKRQVDVLGYLVERSCIWRRPSQHEQDELGRLRTGSDGLEWFQDFYAAFLAILAQVYTLGLHWTASSRPTFEATEVNAASGASLSKLVQSEPADGAISNSARMLSQTLSQQMLAGTVVHGRDLLIVSELVVSSTVILSLLIAVRRRDDGPMTLGLSMLGWGSLFAARIIVIALAFVHVGWKVMLPLVLCHVFGITTWIYKIAIDSHNDKASESEESEWVDVDLGNDVERAARGSIELNIGAEAKRPENQDPTQTNHQITNYWSAAQHVILVVQTVTLFAIPSLFYWPIMFNLKMHLRPLKYLVLILSENFMLIPIIWYSISETNATLSQWYLLGAVGAFSIVGFLFIYLYICCKPNLTEYFARADELFNEAECSGVYYEFCARVFKLPDLSKQSFRRLMNQVEVFEETEADET